MHLSLEVVADVGQGFAGDCEDLGVPEVDDIHLGGHTVFVAEFETQRGQLEDGEEEFAFDGELDGCAAAKQFRIFIDGRISDDAQRLIGEDVADTDALVPCPDVFAIGAAAVSGYHASYGAVHKDAGTAASPFDAFVERTDKVRTEDTLA